MKNSLTLIKPVISEKSLKDALSGVFTFIVDKASTKFDIKNAVEKMYKVHVCSLTTVNIKGKTKRAGKKRLLVKGPDIKKARVKLQKGEKIDLFEIGETK